ncbi:hypothetical protein DPSP01_012419 [Paraphaeosphaeria sporulosa]
MQGYYFGLNLGACSLPAQRRRLPSPCEMSSHCAHALLSTTRNWALELQLPKQTRQLTLTDAHHASNSSSTVFAKLTVPSDFKCSHLAPPHQIFRNPNMRSFASRFSTAETPQLFCQQRSSICPPMPKA